MSIRLDKLLVVDCERTCWSNQITPAGQRAEIIEIGITEIDISTQSTIGRSRSYLVSPVHSEVSKFCTELTSITPRMLEKQGKSFVEVCNSIRKEFGGAGKTWAGWGRDDRDIEEECKQWNVPSPFSTSYIDIGQMWNLLVGAEKRIGMKAALASWNMQFQGTQHRGIDDSHNLARLFIEMSKYTKNFANRVDSTPENLLCQPNFTM